MRILTTRRAASAIGLVLVLSSVAPAADSSKVSVRIEPELRLNVSRVSVQVVIPDGPVDDLQSSPINLIALGRPAHGQRIRLTARAEGQLYNAASVVPLTTIRWSAQKTSSYAGGADARCTSGQLQGAPADLIEGWLRPGAVSCAVALFLTVPPGAAPGVYTTTIVFDLHSE